MSLFSFAVSQNRNSKREGVDCRLENVMKDTVLYWLLLWEAISSPVPSIYYKVVESHVQYFLPS
jgi:hypothetical protein